MKLIFLNFQTFKTIEPKTWPPCLGQVQTKGGMCNRNRAVKYRIIPDWHVHYIILSGKVQD